MPSHATPSPPPPPPPPNEAIAVSSPSRSRRVSDGSSVPPPPPYAPPPPQPSSQDNSMSSIPAHVKAATSSPISASSNGNTATSSGSAPSSPCQSNQTPHSKLVNHSTLDVPDELDRKWYAHYYHMQKMIQGKDEASIVSILKQQQLPATNTPAFQPEVALLYVIITEPPLAKSYLRFLTAIAATDSYKSIIGWLQKLIDQKFVRLLGSCRSQLLWLLREFVHSNVPGVDKVIIVLLRHLTGGDVSRTAVWLASSIVRILIEHESWLLSSTTLIPFVFHTFARIVVDHTNHASLLQQEIELCTTLWNRRQSDVAQLGREVVRVLNDAKDIPGMNALWKQLRSVRDDGAEQEVYSVARLMSIPTPPKYLAYRLTPKMEEHLVFIMERVALSSVTRYQKWFATQFLSAIGSDALVPDLVRYICAVYHPSNQILGSKITPRYHILGWLYLLCKSPVVLARVQLAMFFDYLYFKPNDNIMNVEPAMLLMAKSLKSHPQMTLAMIQFLVFAVEKFAASVANKHSMQKGVSTAFTMLLKVGVVPSIHPLQSFSLLQSSAPELKSELHRIFPEHFPSPDAVQAPTPASPLHHSPALSNSPMHSPGSLSSPLTPQSPAHESPRHSSHSPLHSSPLHTQSPSHSESSAVSVVSSSDTLSSSTFLPDNTQPLSDTTTSSDEPEGADGSSTSTFLDQSLSSGLAKAVISVPSTLIVLGHEEFTSFQEMMPEPCTRPSERFLESLNDILISWIRQDDALELASTLGTYLHAALEKIFVSSKIKMSRDAKATCAGVFDSMLDQVLSESQDLYVPFLQAMHTRDATIGFRLLAFCIFHSQSKSIEATLAPYIAFVDAIGGNLTQNLVKDLSLSQHVDDARAHAVALLGKPSGASNDNLDVVKDEVGAVDVAVLYILPYLFRHLETPTLSKLMGRSELLIQLLLSLLTPTTFQLLIERVIMQEFTIVRPRLANVLVASLSWCSWEQFVLWDLVIVELQVSTLNSPNSIKDFMAATRKVLVCVNPEEHMETINGLLKCLLHISPDTNLLGTIIKLNSSYETFALSVLSNWMDKYPEVIKNYILVSLQTNKDVEEILHKLEVLQRRRISHTISILKDDVILSALSKIVGSQTFPTLSNFLLQVPRTPPPPSSPTLSSAKLAEEPPTKKQRLLGDN